MNLSQTAALLTLCLTITASFINASKIIKRQVEPTLSTWVIFLVATGMSFVSYLISSHKDFSAGALNGADVLSDVIIILAIVFFGAARWNLRPFEKYYFSGLVLISAFWFLTSDAFRSNLFIQVMLTLGYFPTAHTIIKSKRNTESFVVWGLILISSFVSLFPALSALNSNGNILGLVYSVRSIALISLLMVLMFFYHKKIMNKPVS